MHEIKYLVLGKNHLPMNETRSLVSIRWDDVCRPKSHGGLGLKSMHEWNVSLMAKHLWNIIIDKDTIWVKWVKIHNVKGKNLWDIKLNKEYDIVINVPVLTLNNDVEDRTIWCNKKGKEKESSASEVWKAIKIDYPNVIWVRSAPSPTVYIIHIDLVWATWIRHLESLCLCIDLGAYYLWGSKCTTIVVSMLGQNSLEEYQEYKIVSGFLCTMVSRRLWGRFRQVLYSFFPVMLFPNGFYMMRVLQADVAEVI
nr:RNA-directed DNA polymerase, eukaryota, reverse transcriptase zinc-binding domain protein [Tanacetum cinerariifolium]